MLRSSFQLLIKSSLLTTLIDWRKITVVQVFNWGRKQSKGLIICGILGSVNSTCSTFCFISCLHPKKTSVYQLFSLALETWMFESQLKKKKRSMILLEMTRSVHQSQNISLSKRYIKRIAWKWVIGWVHLTISIV